MDFLKDINPQLVAVQIVCFLLVLSLLRWKLWGPVFQVLEDRQNKIAAEFQAIEDMKADLARTKEEYAGHLARIDQAAQDRLREVERQGEEKTRQARIQAREEADRIIEDARKEIRFELVKAKADIRGDVVEMVVTLTEKMIQEKLTFENDKTIVEHMLEELDKTHER